MRRTPSLATAVIALLVAAFGAAPTATASSTLPAAPTRLAAYNCDLGHFCIYSDWNGGGSRCQWLKYSKANTADDCAFIQRGENVRSVWNRAGHRVQYYTTTNHRRNRVGSTPAGSGGNLQGDYQIRSFKPQ